MERDTLETNPKVGKFKYDRTNSKGEVKLRRETNQTLKEVETFLEENNIKFETINSARLIKIFHLDVIYQYFWTTGRWGVYRWHNYPSKHYMSKGVEDFYIRFLKSKETE
jgi:hypothetical protein